MPPVLARPFVLPARVRHPDQLLAGSACLVGLAALVELVAGSDSGATWTGLLALLLAGLAHVWSPVRPERLDLAAAVLGALAVAVGAAHGALGS